VLRRQGFVDAAGDDLEIVWEHEVPFSSDLPEAVRERVRTPDVTLIACANDAIAVGALRALRQGGLRVPHDVSLVGFDDVPWAEIIEPALTTVRQPLAELGSAAVKALHNRITHPDRPLRYETYPVEIVERRSVASLGPRADRRDASASDAGDGHPSHRPREATAEREPAKKGPATRQRIRVERG
jgi:LacI family transcriptional regulator